MCGESRTHSSEGSVEGTPLYDYLTTLTITSKSDLGRFASITAT